MTLNIRYAGPLFALCLLGVDASAQSPADTWIECRRHPNSICLINRTEDDARQINDAVQRAAAIAMIAAAAARMGRIEMAQSLVATIDHRYWGPLIHALCELGRSQAAAGRRTDAVESFKAAVQSAGTQNNTLARADRLLGIAKAASGAGFRDESSDILNQGFELIRLPVQDTEPKARNGSLRGRRAHLLSAIAIADAQAGDTANALEIAAAIDDDSIEQARALLAVADEQKEAGALDQTVKSLDLALVAAERKSYIDRILLGGHEITIDFNWGLYARLLADIARAQGEMRLSDKAGATFNEAIVAATSEAARWDRSSALSYIADAQATVGFETAATKTRNQALRSAEAIAPSLLRVEALVGVAVSQAKAGSKLESASTFDEALEVAGKLANEDHHARTLLQIAEGEVKAAFAIRARETFHQALRVWMLTIKAPTTPLWDIPLEIAMEQREAGFTDDARATFAQYLVAAEADGSRPHAYASLWSAISQNAMRQLFAQAEDKDPSLIIGAATAISDPLLRVTALCALAESLS